MKWLLISLGCIGSALTFVYSVCLPLALAFGDDFDAFVLIEFISIGFKKRCGLTIAVLGFPSLVILLSHLAAVLMSSSLWWLGLIFWCMEFAGWFVILGYECTGVEVHNAGLFCFLAGVWGIHYVFCRSQAEWQLVFYKRVNVGILITSLSFGVVSFISTLPCCEHREIQNAALFVEFFLMFLVTVQQFSMFYVFSLFESDFTFSLGEKKHWNCRYAYANSCDEY